MTTAYRDTATRCRRCQRVTTGCAELELTWRTELTYVAFAEWLCTRCRCEVREAVIRLVDGAELREVMR